MSDKNTVTLTLGDIKMIVPKVEKVKIIALTGQIGIDLQSIQDTLCMHRQVVPLKRIHTGEDGISSDEFLKKVMNGDIIEATCEKDDEVYGTDLSQLLTSIVYVGFYTPEQIDNLMKSNKVEVFPLVVKMDSKHRLLHLLDNQRKLHLSIAEICEKFIYDEEHYDLLDYEGDNWYSVYFPTHDDLANWTGYHALVYDIVKFNNEYRLITDLDNFLQ